MYKTTSAIERGTLFNLRNQLNRRNVSKKCKKDLNAHEDFFELVVEGHVVAAVMEYLKMDSISDLPSKQVIPDSDEMWMEDDIKRESVLMNVARSVASQHINLSMRDIKTPAAPILSTESYDGILAYSREVISLGLILGEFKDAIKEGDGNRCLRVWKYFLLFFKVSNQTNYAMEALNLLAQYHIVLPPRLAEGLKWSRFVNTRGLPGHNISCDLHMEHMNKVIKATIEGLGANKAQTSIIRCGKMVGILESTLEKFDEESGVNRPHGTHMTKAFDKDFNKILKQLCEIKSFRYIPGRKHKSFTHIQESLIQSVNPTKLDEWILTSFTEKYL